MVNEFVTYFTPGGECFADTATIQSSDNVGEIRHLGFGNFQWISSDATGSVIFHRVTDRAKDCPDLPPAWADEWSGRVHRVFGDIESLTAALVGLWPDRKIEVFSIEGGRGYMAKARSRPAAAQQ